MQTTRQPLSDLHIGFIAAQVAVIFPLLAVGQWLQVMYREGYRPLSVPLTQHWLFWLLLVIAGITALGFLSCESQHHKQSALWFAPTQAMLVSVGLMFLLPVPLLLFGNGEACTKVLSALGILVVFCFHFQAWASLLYFHKRLRGAEPNFHRIKWIGILGAMPLALVIGVLAFLPSSNPHTLKTPSAESDGAR